MTRRGRLALTLSVSALLLVATTAALSTAAATGPAPARTTPAAPVAAAGAAPSEVVVLPGDTLWSIADEVALPDQDVRDVVLRIQEANELPTAALSVGDRLVVPA